jgi:adenosylcobinamide-GDP ribazoletransferase
VGAASGVTYQLAFARLGATVAALLSLGASLLLTGAFHEDGLADTFDALGGAHDRARVFEILKDSRIGTFGALALFVSLGLRVACLALFDGPSGAAALLASHTLGRLGPVWLLARLPYVTPEGSKAREVVAGARVTQALIATLWGLLVATLITLARSGSLAGLGCALLAVAAVASLFGAWFVQRTGGLTGDFLGAAEQAGEVGVLLALVAVWLAH